MVGKTGLLLINLGTPESPRPADVRPYLREFLMDERVIDIPAWRRWLLVHLLILPFRPKASGEAYEKVWTEEGSPLLIYSRQLTEKVSRRLGPGVEVELAMRYGNPSVADGLAALRRRGVDRLVVFPLYPQYSSAANGSSLQKVYAEAAKLWNVPDITTVPPFYDHPGFIEANARVVAPYLEKARPEKVFFSFHGLPQRQVCKSDETGAHCLKRDDCCRTIVEANRNCYSAQCYATARLLGDRLGIPEEQRVVCFQSRLGRTPWLKPYTDMVLAEHARRGVKRALILAPAFVADCLETIEELGIRAVETWQENGGELLERAPCVNSTDDWADVAVRLVHEATAWIGPTGSAVAADR